MLSSFVKIDKALFSLLNSTVANGFFDRAMPLITNQETGIVIILTILLILGIFGGKRGRIAVLAAFLAFTIIDPFGHYILKPLFARVRPCNEGIGRLLVECGSGFSMPSLHAASSFGVFSTFVFFYGRRFAPVLIIPALVAYSRVYVGVHWPGDIFVGAIFGTMVAWGVSSGAMKIFYKQVPSGKPQKKYCPFCGAKLVMETLRDTHRLVCSRCKNVLYENPLPAIAIVVYNDEGSVLLVERATEPAIGEWALPGGFVEMNETPIEAAIRELKEETGIVGKFMAHLGVEGQKSNLYTNVMVAGILLKASGGKLEPGDDAKSAAWFSPDAIARPPFASHRIILERGLAEIAKIRRS